nr:hypothetical protein [uncultured Rhodopila sp.]
MPSTHLYPDPSDLSPVFLSGELDLDDTDLVSSVAFGEAILSAHGTDGPLAFAVPAHAAAARAARDHSRFMFGLLPEQPRASLPDESFLNLGPTEQA